MSYKDSSMVSKDYALSLCLALALTVLLDSSRGQSLIAKKNTKTSFTFYSIFRFRINIVEQLMFSAAWGAPGT